MKQLLIIIGITLFLNCSNVNKDNFTSNKVISSKGEKIYINSLNWGVTNDYQMTAISSNPNKLHDRTDSINTVKGIDPFIYSFDNDTLNLFFQYKISYKTEENFKSVKIIYNVVDRKKFIEISEKANINKIYHKVPLRKEFDNDTDLPKAPTRN